MFWYGEFYKVLICGKHITRICATGIYRAWSNMLNNSAFTRNTIHHEPSRYSSHRYDLHSGKDCGRKRCQRNQLQYNREDKRRSHTPPIYSVSAIFLPGPTVWGLHILLSRLFMLVDAGRLYHVTSGRGTPVTLHTRTTVSPSWNVTSFVDSSSMMCAGTANIK